MSEMHISDHLKNPPVNARCQKIFLMFKKRKKKALSHVDWAISLGIFLMYLTWFFIMIKPMVLPSEGMGTMLDVLESGIKSEVGQDVSRIKVFIPDNVDSEFEPVIIPFSQTWPESDMSVTADYFAVDENKMFFLANISDSSTYEIYYPFNSLKMSDPHFPFADSDSAKFESFEAYFNSGLLDRIYFKGSERLSGFSVGVDDSVFDPVGDTSNNSVFYKYSAQGDSLNVSTYFFGENSRLYMYLAPADFINHTLKINFDTFNYTDYYFDSSRNGVISYRIGPNCKYYASDFLYLSDEESGLLVTVDKNISYRFCANETNPSLRLEFDLDSEININVFLDTVPVSYLEEYPLNPVSGVVETLNTMSSEKISLLRGKDYNYLKTLFGFPQSRDFNVTFTSGVISASVGASPPDVVDVYARRLEGVMMNSNYSQQRVQTLLTVW